jgi:FAD/FMN-containing dehydrogenase
MPVDWSNWSGSVRCSPARLVTPKDEAEIAAEVRGAAADGLRVRVAGTGHSFTPLVATDGVLVSLAGWAGIESCDPERRQATVRAGTTLHVLGEELLGRGLAMENLGDVDVQALGGAIGTGTHGTGPTFGNLSTQVLALRLVTATGDVLDCSAEREPEVFRAARVSLGLLGIVSAVTLRLVPAFRLHERVWRLPAEECLERLDRLIARNEHFEFFWDPADDEAECKSLNTTEKAPEDADILEGERIGWSAHIIPSVRSLTFNEMEYAVPAALGPDCFRAVRRRMRERHPGVTWPVEYRTLTPDDAYLSPAYGRETVTISIHQSARRPYQDFFADIEAIFRAHGGRPHWGKIHNLRAAELHDLYPMWDRFQAVRTRLDPDGRFLNDYLREVFGIDAPARR